MSISLIFRFLFAAIFMTGFTVSLIHRTRAQLKDGSVSEAYENRIIYVLLRSGGFIMWVSCFMYIFYPRSLAWSFLPLPIWMQWVGVLIGVIALPLTTWAALTIGNNVTRTVLTRQDHELVTWGPYRYIRHPLYSFGIMFFLGLSLISASALMLGLTAMALVLILLRLPQEEAMLIAHFGEAYSDYRMHTGAIIPRIS